MITSTKNFTATAQELAWKTRAACINHYDPSIFLYPLPGPGLNAKDRTEMARAVCAPCTVREECELAGCESPGIWGGYTERERDQRRAERNRLTLCEAVKGQGGKRRTRGTVTCQLSKGHKGDHNGEGAVGQMFSWRETPR